MLPSLLITIVQENLTRGIGKENKINGIQIETVKISPFAGSTMDIENPEGATENLLELQIVHLGYMM